MPTHTSIDPKKLLIGRRIATARAQAGLSQEQLGSQIGVSAGAVAQWETGRTMPNMARFRAVAKVLEVEVEWLLTGDDPDEQRRAQTAIEAEALRLVRSLDGEGEELALAMLRTLAGQRNKI